MITLTRMHWRDWLRVRLERPDAYLADSEQKSPLRWCLWLGPVLVRRWK